MKDLYIASCTEDGGIYHCTCHNGTFEMKEKTPVDRPMYLTVENGNMYVLLREAFDNRESGMCSFDIADDGRLINKSDLLSTKGIVACHICTDNSDGGIYAVNYLSGNVIRFPDTIARHSGKGPNPERQEAPHTHFVGITPDNQYVCVTDLGLDKIFFYDKNLNLKFSISVLPGYGVRHLAFSEDGKYLYCVNEIVSSVTVFRYDGENTRYLDTYPALPDSFHAHSQAAAIRISKNRVYVSNRGHDSIAVFDICDDKLKLAEFIPTGREPRDFNIFDDILVSCNMLDNNVTFYSLRENNKKLQTIPVDMPLCVVSD